MLSLLKLKNFIILSKNLPSKTNTHYLKNNLIQNKPMMLKYMKREIKTLLNLKYSFAKPQKKRTQAPRYVSTKQQDKIDPQKIDYSKVPQEIRKAVKANVQANNMLTTSQAEYSNIALRQIILEERDKFKITLDQMDQPQQLKTQKVKNQQDSETVQQKNYDLIKALRFTSNVANILMVANIAGYGLLQSFKKYEFLGFFLGLSINPSIITLTGLSIGFNAASWIITQSLHLQIRDPNQLTPEKISLTNCTPIMYLEALSIAAQTAGLSYYLIQPHPEVNMPFLLGSFVLAQSHMVYSVIKATGGYRFEYFSKLVFAQMSVSLLISVLVYSLFQKIAESEGILDQCQTINGGELAGLNEGLLVRRGYYRFLSQFKTKDVQVVKGQAINKIVNEETQ